MKYPKRALIALDLSTMDEQLMDAMLMLQPTLQLEQLYFLHVMPDFTAPRNLDAQFQKMFAPEMPVDERARNQLAQKVQEKFDGQKGLKLQVDVREGKPYQKVIHWLEVKEAELLVVGNKKQSAGSGITARKAARKVDSHLLLVPDAPLKPIQKILVPVDFSDHSARALHFAETLSGSLPEAELDTLYVIDLPPLDYYALPYDQSGFRKVLLESAEQNQTKFFKDHQFDPKKIQAKFIENTYSNAGVHVHEFAVENDYDLIVIGAQGHSALESFVFGSVTEKLATVHKDCPIFVVR